LPSAELTPIEVWSLILEESTKIINPQTFKTCRDPPRPSRSRKILALHQRQEPVRGGLHRGQYGSVLSRIAGSLFDTDLSIAFQSDSSDSPRRSAPPIVSLTSPPVPRRPSGPRPRP
jgi:hypothetical protein